MTAALRRLALLGALCIGGCGIGGGQAVPYQTSSPTTEALRAFSLAGPQGATLRLAEATSFEWDQAYFFAKGSKREDVAEVVGADVFAGRTGRLYEPGPLLVFTRGGAVVEAVCVIPPLFLSSADRSAHSPDSAVVRAHSKPPAPHLLVLE